MSCQNTKSNYITTKQIKNGSDTHFQSILHCVGFLNLTFWGISRVWGYIEEMSKNTDNFVTFTARAAEMSATIQKSKLLMYCKICKIPHLLEFLMLLGLLSNAYLMFYIKINDDSCDLLFHTHFIFLDQKHDSRYNS